MIRRHMLALAIAPALMLAACSEPESADPLPAERADPAPDASPEAEPEAPQSEAGAPTETGDAPQGFAAIDVPLTPGVYVLEGTSCETPANAAWRIWDGDGLSGASTEDCEAEIISHEGRTYRMRNSCVNTYDGSRTPETLTMTVPDQAHFSVNGQAFKSCASGELPDWLQERFAG